MAKKNNFFITDADKEWVHENFTWLKEFYGYPDPDFSPVLFTQEFFPNAIGQKSAAIEPLIRDLCNLFVIDPTIISFNVEEDIRDSHGTPYEIQGNPFECELEVISINSNPHYKLHFSKSLLNNPKRLVFNSIFHFIQIKMGGTDSEWIGNEEYHLLFYLIGIYTGWGLILSQTMTDVGMETDGFWERSWKYISPMPIPVMAYSLALHSDMTEQKRPDWEKFLPTEIRNQFQKAIEYIGKEGNPAFNKQELMAKTLFKQAQNEYDAKDFDSSIETYQKSLFLTADTPLIATIYNNIGYNLLWKNEFAKSIEYFRKAFETNPEFAYAYDNIGFAFIMLGDTDSGKHYLTLALETNNNDRAYSYRNLALYHQKRKETTKAREYFQKAMDNITQPVDFLEYYYARFLFEQGEHQQSLQYLKIAVEKEEPLAIQWTNELNKNI
ncbi:tetratricopeptide repeat protein [Terrimonas pollutisoli]|uniref:tetratricopeptide repeat protein n=1 Tax=Terrimonas pollutisoli TaxID=3034147 RepID=UPI0023ECDBCE|nr:tetratricopeptide repeat protein [Terrimonas sp. H1YJ31]